LLDGRLADREVPAPAREWLTALRGAVARASSSLRGLEDLGGSIEQVRISGGWAANPVLRRLKMEAFPNTAYPRVGEAGARGAALLAGQAAGAFASADSFPPPTLTDEPAADDAALGPSRPLSLSNQPNESFLP
jgi:sugar (pentulose or hexulose) kinase